MGSVIGSIYTITCMSIWILIPMVISVRKFKKKDL
jgi:hypothetical protein